MKHIDYVLCIFRISIQPEMPTIPFNKLDDQACPEENSELETEVQQHPSRKRWRRWILPTTFLGLLVAVGIVCIVYDLTRHSSSKGILIYLTVTVIRAAERGQGHFAPGPQAPRDLIASNAARPCGTS